MFLSSILIFAVMLGIITALLKGAAIAYRRASVSWKNALLFSVLYVVASGVVFAVWRQFGGLRLSTWPFSLVLAVLLNIALLVSFGGWYLGPRAASQSGAPVGFAGGATIGFILWCFIFVISMVFMFGLPAVRGGLR